MDLLLFVALQVSIERTSFRPKFFITSSLRVTPFLTVTVLLLTSLSSRCQDTVGAGLPVEKNASLLFFAQFFQLFPESLRRSFATENFRPVGNALMRADEFPFISGTFLYRQFSLVRRECTDTRTRYMRPNVQWIFVAK